MSFVFAPDAGALVGAPANVTLLVSLRRWLVAD